MSAQSFEIEQGPVGATPRMPDASAEPHQGEVSSTLRFRHEIRPVLVEIYRPLDMAVAGVGLFWVGGAANPGARAGWDDVLGLQVTLGVLLLGAAFLVLWHASFAAVELYDERRLRGWRAEAQRLFVGTLPGTAVVLAYLAAREPAPAGVQLFGAVAGFWAIAFLGTLGARSALRHAIPAPRRETGKRVLILGNGPRAQRVLRALHDDAARPAILGFLDSGHDGVPADVRRLTLGGLDDLEAVLMRSIVDEVVIALPVRSKYAEIQDALHTCERMGVNARYLADVFDWEPGRVRLDDRAALQSVALRAVSRDYRRRIKRGIELAATVIAIVLLAPVMALIALAIKVQDGGPVLFVQRRHGLHKRVFPMLKFRTMVPDAEALQAALESRNEASGAVFKIHDDPRVTRLGAFLRRTSLDELPQLFNVLAGQMSIVGPRPLPIRDVRRFDHGWAMRRFSVRPGVTGLWQVSGRSDLSFDELVAADLRYIDDWSLRLDLEIILRTFGAVLRRRGAA